jgi:hypothetical protein
MNEHSADEYVSIEKAARSAGIPARTLRSWTKDGKLPAIAGKRGQLVNLREVIQIGVELGRIPDPTRQPAGNENLPATSAGNVADFLAIIERQAETITQLEARFAGMEGKLDQVLEQLQSMSAITAGNLPSPADVEQAPTAPEMALGASENVQAGDQTLEGEAGQASRLRSWWEWLKRH